MEIRAPSSISKTTAQVLQPTQSLCHKAGAPWLFRCLSESIWGSGLLQNDLPRSSSSGILGHSQDQGCQARTSRLALCGAVLLTKLLKNTAAVMGVLKEHWHAWTDSAIVLAWLDGQPRDFKTYVSNRVSFIMQATSPQIWRHVPTAENPADCASRGMMLKELLEHNLWWNGPCWLSQDPIPIPKQPPRRTLITPELKTVHVVSLQSSIAMQIGNISSNYHTTLAIAAWCLRFCHRIKHGRPDPDNRTKHLTGTDITSAEHWLLREAQARAYPKERKALLKNQKISNSSRLKALSPLLDEEQLLRVGG